MVAASCKSLPSLVLRFAVLSKHREQRYPLALLSFLLVLFIIASKRRGQPEPVPPQSPSSLRVKRDPPSLCTFAIIASSFHTVQQVRSTIDSVHSLQLPTTITHVVHFSSHNVPEIALLTDNYHRIASRRLYDDPVTALTTPLHASGNHTGVEVEIGSQGKPSTLWLVAGTVISPAALQWLSGAYAAYAHRPDVAAFALDTVSPVTRQVQKYESASSPMLSSMDHEEHAWKVVDMERLSSNSAFIYRSCPKISAILLNTVNVSPHFRPWALFAEWLQLRRGDWYRFPSGLGVDDTPFGMSAVPHRNWTRASWNVWLSKFLHEYQLGVVYPILGNDGQTVLAVNDHVQTGGAFPKTPTKHKLLKTTAGMRFEEDIVTLTGSGKSPEQEYFSKETVKRIVDVAKAQDGVISFTMVNKVFLETARSWLCNVDVGGFRPTGLVWAVTDYESYEALKDVPETTTVWLNEVKGGKETGHDFGNPGYWKLMLERTALITEILNEGVGVFAFETDAIWLESPFRYIQQLIDEEADMVGTINTRMEVSGNFFYLHPTLATRRLWGEITGEFEKAYGNAHLEDKNASSWTYIENDQSLLTKLVLRNETWRARYPVNLITLDMEKFVDGRWYDTEGGFYSSARARRPVVINNNFVIGVDKKTERAKSFGHWFWDEKKLRCDRPAVKRALTVRTKR